MGEECGGVDVGPWRYVSMCMCMATVLSMCMATVLTGEFGWIGLGSMVVCIWVHGGMSVCVCIL